MLWYSIAAVLQKHAAVCPDTQKTRFVCPSEMFVLDISSSCPGMLMASRSFVKAA